LPEGEDPLHFEFCLNRLLIQGKKEEAKHLVQYMEALQKPFFSWQGSFEKVLSHRGAFLDLGAFYVSALQQALQEETGIRKKQIALSAYCYRPDAPPIVEATEDLLLQEDLTELLEDPVKKGGYESALQSRFIKLIEEESFEKAFQLLERLFALHPENKKLLDLWFQIKEKAPGIETGKILPKKLQAEALLRAKGTSWELDFIQEIISHDIDPAYDRKLPE
jgi:hypothetical protein